MQHCIFTACFDLILDKHHVIVYIPMKGSSIQEISGSTLVATMAFRNSVNILAALSTLIMHILKIVGRCHLLKTNNVLTMVRF